MEIKNKILGKDNNQVITRLIFFLPILFIIVAFILDNPINLYEGLIKIATTPDAFATDYFTTVGVGTAFLNAGLLCLIYAILLKVFKANMGGLTLAAQYICVGYGFFGKNIFNFAPIYLGVFLYSLFRKEKFKNYIYYAMFSSAMAPLVSHLYCNLPFEIGINILISVLVGIVFGFLIPALATFTMNVHRGYNLYNLGFTLGLLGLLFVSFLKWVGVGFEAKSFWYEGSNIPQLIFFGVICLLFVLYGFILDKNCWKEGFLISKDSGRAPSDYTLRQGIAPTMFNMGLVGILTILFLIVTKSNLSGGGLFAGLFSILGFAAYGKNIRNVSYIFLGGILGSLLGFYDCSTNIYAFCILLGTCLCPVGGQFGPLWGIITIWCHLAIVTNTGVLHGWLSLYNNGFSAGLVALIIVPIIEGINGGIENAKRRKKSA